jgi:hypothetical protein
MALANFMRLSLMKAAHAGVDGAPCRKSGYVGPFPNSVPQGRLNLAQDASPGLDLKGRPVPQGRLKIGLDEILDNLQPSLRDLIMFHDVPRTSVLAKFSRPCGTNS